MFSVCTEKFSTFFTIQFLLDSVVAIYYLRHGTS